MSKKVKVPGGTSASDITERKWAEEELRRLVDKESRSAREWQELFDASADIMALISPDFEILRINRAGYEGIGKKREELIGEKCYEVVHGLDSPIDGCPCKELLRTKKAGVSEITQEGRHYIATASPVLDKNGELIAFAHTIHDITERKRMEETLRQSEENLRAYLESAPDGVYLNDLKGKLLYGNKKAEEMTGYEREELVGKSFLKLNLLPAKYLVKASKLLVLNAMGSPTGPDEFELIRKDGRRIWVEINTTPIKQGGKAEVIGFVRDITERKRMERDLGERVKELQCL